MSDVKLVGVAKYYEGGDPNVPALEKTTLSIDSGELVVLVGPSGCGKSTTLRIVAGLEAPSIGRVFIDERDVTDVPPARRDIAMVFQSYALYPHMSVFDNLAFALKLRKVSSTAIERRVKEVARSLGIQEFLHRKPKALSGGQRQRVAMGRAMVREPKVFLFDEPLSNLDAKLRGEMRKEIARIHRQTRTTCLYVTHDQVEAMTLADRIVVLEGGRVQQVGTPTEIYDSPANRFVAGFFGTPSMNVLSATVERGDDGAVAKGHGFALEAPPNVASAGEVLVGFRPEAASLAERPGSAPVRGRVELREVLGADVLLHVRSEAGPLTVKTEDRAAGEEGEDLTVWLDRDRLHFFDARSEARL
jgi:multiple sugar transport system ATP-binding protein